MARSFAVVSTLAFLVLATLALGQNPPASDPQALAYAAQSIAAITGGTAISDVTLTGNVTWNGSDTGTGILRALGSGESRMDLALSSGTRTEVRDTQAGLSLGQWISLNNTSGSFASQNCWTDAAWFFPALGSLAAGQDVVLSYIGQEARNNTVVQHVQSYVHQSVKSPLPGPEQFSIMDFYLDTNTHLPVAVTFNVHPDNDAGTNLLTEIDFASYQVINGVTVPMHIQRFQQGTLMVDFTVSEASFNSGLPSSIFAIN